MKQLSTTCAILFYSVFFFTGCGLVGGLIWQTPLVILLFLLPGCIIGPGLVEKYDDGALAEEIAEVEGGEYCTDGENWVLIVDGEMIVNGTLVPENDPGAAHCWYDVSPTFDCKNGYLVQHPNADDLDEPFFYDCDYDYEKPSFNANANSKPARLKKSNSFSEPPAPGQTIKTESDQIRLTGDGWDR